MLWRDRQRRWNLEWEVQESYGLTAIPTKIWPLHASTGWTILLWVGKAVRCGLFMVYHDKSSTCKRIKCGRYRDAHAFEPAIQNGGMKWCERGSTHLLTAVFFHPQYDQILPESWGNILGVISGNLGKYPQYYQIGFFRTFLGVSAQAHLLHSLRPAEVPVGAWRALFPFQETSFPRRDFSSCRAAFHGVVALGWSGSESCT
jgi:hypothetical protein